MSWEQLLCQLRKDELKPDHPRTIKSEKKIIYLSFMAFKFQTFIKVIMAPVLF